MERLGLSGAAIEDSARLHRRLKQFPEMRRAYELGAISREAAQEVTLILGGRSVESATKRAWVERTKEATIKRLRDEQRAQSLDRVPHRRRGRSTPLGTRTGGPDVFAEGAQTAELGRVALAARKLLLDSRSCRAALGEPPRAVHPLGPSLPGSVLHAASGAQVAEGWSPSEVPTPRSADSGWGQKLGASGTSTNALLRPLPVAAVDRPYLVQRDSSNRGRFAHGDSAGDSPNLAHQ